MSIVNNAGSKLDTAFIVFEIAIATEAPRKSGKITKAINHGRGNCLECISEEFWTQYSKERISVKIPLKNDLH